MQKGYCCSWIKLDKYKWDKKKNRNLKLRERTNRREEKIKEKEEKGGKDK